MSREYPKGVTEQIISIVKEMKAFVVSANERIGTKNEKEKKEKKEKKISNRIGRSL